MHSKIKSLWSMLRFSHVYLLTHWKELTCTFEIVFFWKTKAILELVGWKTALDPLLRFSSLLNYKFCTVYFWKTMGIRNEIQFKFLIKTSKLNRKCWKLSWLLVNHQKKTENWLQAWEGRKSDAIGLGLAGCRNFCQLDLASHRQ